MIAITLTAVLITQTWGGTVSVNDNLSDASCQQARCVALYGVSCEENEVLAREAERREIQEDADWLKEHPRQAKLCVTEQKKLGVSLNCHAPQQDNMTILNPGTITSAACVK